MSPTSQSVPKPLIQKGLWKHGSVPVIGLIGGIGSGKSLVANLLRERGAVVIDADAEGHLVLELPRIRARVFDRFGPGIAKVDNGSSANEGSVDRRALGAIVFRDPAALRDLESILHPVMRDRFQQAIEREVGLGKARAVVLDAAILLEAGWDDLCDVVLFVDTTRSIRLERVIRQRSWTPEAFAARERSQWDVAEKRRRATVVLANDSGLDKLESNVDRFLDSILGTGGSGSDLAHSNSGRQESRGPDRLPPSGHSSVVVFPGQ